MVYEITCWWVVYAASICHGGILFRFGGYPHVFLAVWGIKNLPTQKTGADCLYRLMDQWMKRGHVFCKIGYVFRNYEAIKGDDQTVSRGRNCMVVSFGNTPGEVAINRDCFQPIIICFLPPGLSLRESYWPHFWSDLFLFEWIVSIRVCLYMLPEEWYPLLSSD